MNKHIIGSFIGFSISMTALWGGGYLLKSGYWWSFPLAVTSGIFILGGLITTVLYFFEYVDEHSSQIPINTSIKDYPSGIEDYYETNNFGNCKEPK